MFRWLFGKKKEEKHKINFDYNINDLNNFKKKLHQQEKISDNILKLLEVLLLQSDISVETVIYLMTKIKQVIKEKKIVYTNDLFDIVYEQMLLLYQAVNDEYSLNHDSYNKTETIPKKMDVYLFMGVNGVGKTTTIGKLSYQFKKENKKVLLIAGDTFRAGAIEQLKVWAERTKSSFFFKENAKSPSNVIFEGLRFAQENNYDVVLCDTAGRLQNKVNLMSELSKVNRVIRKVLNYEPKEIFLVLDAMMGQNGINQAFVFKENNPLTGIVLTKFDGTSKAGLILTIKHLYKIDVKYVGIGENINDLIPFNIKDYLLHFLKDFFEIKQHQSISK